MKRYYFDLVGRQTSRYDYRGGDFPSLEKAQQLAELIALDLGLEPEGEWFGWAIAVRNAYGHEYCAIPVQAAA